MVKGKPLSLQLHLLELHGGSLLQPHLIFPKCSLGQAFEWSGKRVALRDVFSSFFQPKFSRFILKVLGSTLTSRHIIAWKCALFTFSMNASLVGDPSRPPKQTALCLTYISSYIFLLQEFDDCRRYCWSDIWLSTFTPKSATDPSAGQCIVHSRADPSMMVAFASPAFLNETSIWCIL